MKTLFLLTAICLNLFWTQNLFAQKAEPSPNVADELQRAATLYTAKDYQTAYETLRQLLKSRPSNAVIYHNLSLCAFELHKKGLAIALNRRALRLDPWLRVARNAQKSFTKGLPAENFTWVTGLHEFYLDYIPFWLLGFSTILFFTIGLWILITWIGKRRLLAADIETSEQMSDVPPWTFVASVLITLFFSTSFILKLYEFQISHATIIADKVQVRSHPSLEAPSLFEMREGIDVDVELKNGDWVQITHPDGFSGWVPSRALYKTSGP